MQISQVQRAAAEQFRQPGVRDLSEFRFVDQVEVIELEGLAGTGIEARAKLIE
jgi:hypothetical protein